MARNRYRLKHRSSAILAISNRCNILNILMPRQNGLHFPEDIFKCIFLNENAWIFIKISLKFVPNGSIENILALVQIMAWRRPTTSHCLIQWWLVNWCIYASLGQTPSFKLLDQITSNLVTSRWLPGDDTARSSAFWWENGCYKHWKISRLWRLNLNEIARMLV